jgi:predicted ATPase/DNA-binding SARP family transcriptional activator
MEGLSIALLGEPRLAYAGAALSCPSKKALGLFIYVALAGGRRPRRELARLFWGGGNDDAARTSLRTALQRLPAPLADALALERDSIALIDGSKIELDTARFAALAGHDDAQSLQLAAALYGGELLTNLDVDATPEFDDWLHRERTHYRQLAQSVFDRLIAHHRDRAQRDSARAGAEREAALAAARRWVALEPAAEAAHRWLMQLYFEAGRREAAQAQYEICQRELAVAFGRGPGAQTRALADAVGSGACVAPAGDAAVRAPELAGTSFVGRVDELAALDRLLADPACRLITLHALGGMGKSRLAFALVNQVAARHAQGASWVALDAVASAEQLPQAIAAALGIELAPHAEPAATLAAALRAQDRLVVLDNLEHLLGDGSAADLVLVLLREAPRLKLLVTSREVLGLQEEWVYELTGLAVPAADAAPGEYPAVELFVQRARQAHLGFSAAAEWPSIVRICRITEGLPLALELVAAWVRTLPCRDLAHAIEGELAGLAARHRNRPPRQRSLDAVVRTSWSLLEREQQRALAALAPFVGGFTQEAAHVVAEAPLRVLSALADKALITRRVDGRLRLHELVRQFAQAQLAQRPPAAQRVRRRFAAYFAALLSRCRASLDSRDEADAEATLTAELPNIVAASMHWLDDGISADAVAEPMVRVLVGRGRAREACAQADRLLAAGLNPAARAPVLALRGRAHASLRDSAASRADFDAAIAVAREHDLRHALAYATVHSIVVPFIDDDLELARRRLDEVEPLLAGIDDPLLRLRAQRYRGQLLHAEGRSAEAAEQLRAAVVLARAIGSPSWLAALQASLGGPLIQLGRFDEAEAMLREALPPLESIDSAEAPRVLNSLAVLVLWRAAPGAATEAAQLATRALARFEQLGYATGISGAADTLGQALRVLGRLDEARALLERAAATGGPIVEAEAKFHLVLLDIEQGRLHDARRRALEHLDLVPALPVELRAVTLLAASLAAREPAGAAAARRWLLALLAGPELSFDHRQLADALLASLPAGRHDAVAPVADLAAELREYLSGAASRR